MKRSTLVAICVAGLTIMVLSAASHATARAGERAQASTGRVVKYAYVVLGNQGAEICYAEPQGCRIDRITALPVRVKDPSVAAVDGNATSRNAMVKAVTILGDAGWEMIGPGQAYGHAGSEPAVHFRLLR